jgi:hypothetical protein
MSDAQTARISSRCLGTAGPEHLHGAVIIDPARVARLVIERLAEAGFVMVAADH